MSGPKRNPDKLNTIGIVVVGICGAVLVYVSIVALQAFYMNDTSEIQTMADYGGNDVTARSIRTTQISNINEYGTNPGEPGAAPQSYRIAIDHAMKLVVERRQGRPGEPRPDARAARTSRRCMPIFGRPKPLAAPAPAPPAPMARRRPAGASRGAGAAARR